MADPKNSRDPAEQRKRQQAVDFARASVRLEGFTPSADAEEWAARFVADEHAEIVLRQGES